MIVTMKVPKHLLNATEYGIDNLQKCSRIISHQNANTGQIFKQNPLFFIIQDCFNQIKALFSLKVLFTTTFPQFDKRPGKYTS